MAFEDMMVQQGFTDEIYREIRQTFCVMILKPFLANIERYFKPDVPENASFYQYFLKEEYLA